MGQGTRDRRTPATDRVRVIRQGEIYDHITTDGRYRVLVVSGDAHNKTHTPWVVPIRHGSLDAPPYRIALVDADPLGGSVDIERLTRTWPCGEPVGIVTGATMQRVREAIQALFDG